MLAVTVLVAVLSLSSPASSQASGCGGVGHWTVVCDNTGSSIEIGAGYDDPGASDSSYSVKRRV